MSYFFPLVALPPAAAGAVSSGAGDAGAGAWSPAEAGFASPWGGVTVIGMGLPSGPGVVREAVTLIGGGE